MYIRYYKQLTRFLNMFTSVKYSMSIPLISLPAWLKPQKNRRLFWIYYKVGPNQFWMDFKKP